MTGSKINTFVVLLINNTNQFDIFMEFNVKAYKINPSADLNSLRFPHCDSLACLTWIRPISPILPSKYSIYG